MVTLARVESALQKPEAILSYGTESVAPLSRALVSTVSISQTAWHAHRAEFMAIEESAFKPGLRFDENEKQGLMTRSSAIVVIATYLGRIIGEAYGGPLEEELPEAKEGREAEAFTALFLRYAGTGARAFYVDSFAVLRNWQGQGNGTAIKRALFTAVKKAGYDVVVGHANAGQAIDINLKFGAKVISSHKDWYGTGETHYLYELKLAEMSPTLKVSPAMQKVDYNCGPASLSAIFGYYGIREGEEALAKLLGTTGDAGTTHGQLAAVAKSFGFSVEEKYGASANDITESIDNGIPPLVNYFLEEEQEGHYSPVVGYDKSNFIIMDVADGRYKTIPKSELERVWFSKRYGNRWMLMVFPPVTTPSPTS